MTAGVQPTDPAVQAAIEAGARHSVPTPSLGIQCSCGADILTLAEREEHFTTVRVEAARPIIEAEVRDKLLPRTFNAISGASGRDAGPPGLRLHTRTGRDIWMPLDENDLAGILVMAQYQLDRLHRAAVRTEPEK
jgi:hypothetical protein